MTRQLTFIALAALLFSVAPLLAQDDEPSHRPAWMPGVAGEDGDIPAPVIYKDPSGSGFHPMLVLATDKGAMAVVFLDEIKEPDLRGIVYRYRYESFDGKEKSSGKIDLYQHRDAKGTLGGNTNLMAGDIKVGWSMGGPTLGWLYYNPSKVRIYPAKAAEFSARAEDSPFSDSRIVPALDLQRFKPAERK